MKKKILILLLVSISLGLYCVSLDGQRYANDGVDFYRHGDYKEAIESFILANDSSDGEVAEYFYWLAKLNIALNNTSEAAKWIDKYLESNDNEYRQELLNLVEIMDQQMMIFEKVTLRKTPNYINSQNSDFGPIVTPDGQYLYFTSMRPSKYEKENIFRAEKLNNIWGRPYLVEELASDKNEAIGSFSLSGDIAYLFGNYQSGKMDGDIYQSEFNGKWSKPQAIDAVNTDYIEVQPMVHNDTLLFFVSSRPGGFGGTDIYVSLKKDDVWSEAINLGPEINTDGNEQTPFFDWDEKTLFFASDTHPGLGGFDIFKVVHIGEKWTDWSLPENLGIPINSIKDDRYFQFVIDSNEAYFSSDRESEGFENMLSLSLKKALRSYLIYDEMGNKIRVYDEDVYDTIDKLITFQGKILNEDNQPLVADVVFNYKRNKMNMKDLTESDSTGFFSISIPLSSLYQISVNKDGYFLNSRDFKPAITDSLIVMDFILEAMEVEKVFVFNNIQYEFDSAKLLDSSKEILNDIVLTLLNNPEVKIEVSGHTCNIGSDKYNQKLSEKRAKSVVDYLLSKGIDAERLISRGFGETKPIADNDSEEGRILNRRTELKVLE